MRTPATRRRMRERVRHCPGTGTSRWLTITPFNSIDHNLTNSFISHLPGLEYLTPRIYLPYIYINIFYFYGLPRFFPSENAQPRFVYHIFVLEIFTFTF